MNSELIKSLKMLEIFFFNNLNLVVAHDQEVVQTLVSVLDSIEKSS